MKILNKLFLLNFLFLLIIGFFSFLRFTSVTDLVVPRKLVALFSSEKSLGSLSFINYLPNSRESVAIDSSFASKETLDFLLYPNKAQFFSPKNYHLFETLVLKNERKLEGYTITFSTKDYKIYQRK